MTGPLPDRRHRRHRALAARVDRRRERQVPGEAVEAGALGRRGVPTVTISGARIPGWSGICSRSPAPSLEKRRITVPLPSSDLERDRVPSYR